MAELTQFSPNLLVWLFISFFLPKGIKKRKSNKFRVNFTMSSQLQTLYLYLINTKFGEKWLKSVQWSVLPNEARWDITTWHIDMSGCCDVHRLGELHLNPSQSLQWFFLFPAYEQRLPGNSSKNGRIDPIFTKFFGQIFYFIFFYQKV